MTRLLKLLSDLTINRYWSTSHGPSNLDAPVRSSWYYTSAHAADANSYRSANTMEDTSLFGEGNLEGTVEIFKEQHICNAYCRWPGFALDELLDEF